MFQFLRSFLVASSLLTLALASPVAVPNDIVRRSWPSGSVTCGSTTYTLSEIKDAVTAGVDYLNDPVDSYPHQYHDYEGLEMYCSGDYYNEFPILTDGTYTGGSPGADRVVFTDDGTYCAVITHTGASGDDFVACDGD